MIASSLMRLIVTVGILVAVYFLILKPVLHTTDSISHSVTHAVNHGLHQAEHQFGQQTGNGHHHKGHKN